MRVWAKRRLCAFLLLSYVCLHVKQSYEEERELEDGGVALQDLVAWCSPVDALTRKQWRKRRKKKLLMAACRTRHVTVAACWSGSLLRCVASLIFAKLVRGGDVELNPGPRDRRAAMSGEVAYQMMMESNAALTLDHGTPTLYALLVDTMDNRRIYTIGNLFKRKKKTAVIISNLYKRFEAIMTGKRLYKEVKRTEHNLTLSNNELTKDQSHYSEIRTTVSIEETSERSPFLEACLNGDIEKVREVLNKHEEDENSKDGKGNSALMLAVMGGHKDLVSVLIKDFHFNVNDCQGYYETPLIAACVKGHTDLVRELVNEHGADLSANNDAVIGALIEGHIDLVTVLIKEFHLSVNTSQGFAGITPFHLACFGGHTDLVREFVNEHGADLSVKDDDNRDALMFAVYGGHKDLVRVLINEFHFNINASQNSDGGTPLHVACSRGHTDLVRELVNEHGADLRAIDDDNNDALMYAVYGGHIDLVRVLIKEFHFNVNTSQSSCGITPILKACLEGHTDLVRELVNEHGADLRAKDDYNDDALMLAVIESHEDLIRVLIKEFHFNVNTSRGLNGRTPLHSACLMGHTDLVRELVDKHGADLRAVDDDNYDALMYAVCGGHKDLVRVLIKEYHFNVNTKRGGTRPILETCINGHTDLVRELVNEHGADLRAVDDNNVDALTYAALGGHIDLVRVLIKEYHFNVNLSQRVNGRTPLHAACFKGHTDLVRELVNEHGADLRAIDHFNNDALALAVSAGHIDLVRALIKEFHFNVNSSRGSLLREACINGHTDLVRVLVNELGANFEFDDYSALILAVSEGHIDLVRILINEFHFDVNSNFRQMHGTTPLLVACFKGHTDLARKLVNEHGADLRAKDDYNNDALMLAVTAGHKDLVRVLIKEFHFNVNSSLDLNGRTPLLVACFKGHTDLVRELVNELGADLRAIDDDNSDAFMCTVSGGHVDLARVLIKEFHFNVNASQGLNGRTPLHEACLRGHTILLMDLVCEFGADLYAQDAYGNNGLMYAVEGNKSDIVEFFIDVLGFDVNAGNLIGRTPLLMAFHKDHVDLARELIIRFKADVHVQDRYGYNCLLYAASAGSIAAAMSLITEYDFDVNTQAHNGETPLLVACYYGHVELVTYLVEICGVALDIEAEDMNGNNAVLYAAYGCQESALRFLVNSFGYDVNSSNHDLQTPAFIASLEGNVSLLKVLVTELGASLLNEDKNSESPFSIAVSEGQQDIVEFFVSEFFDDVEKCIYSLLAKFLNKAKALYELSDSDMHMLADVEMCYIQLVQRMKIVAKQESIYNEKMEESKEVMLELEVLLWTRLEERKVTLEKEMIEFNTRNPRDGNEEELRREIRAVEASIITTKQKIEGLMKRSPKQSGLQHFENNQNEMEITIRAGEACSYQCNRYGFKLHIPGDALPSNHSVCTIRVQVNPSFQFTFPENIELISAIYHISCPVELNKPVILEIQHCAIIESPDQLSFLNFVRAEDIHSQLPYQFKPINSGEFNMNSDYAAISLKKFSFLAVVIRKLLLFFSHHSPKKDSLDIPKLDYHVMIYLSPKESKVSWEVMCVLIKHINAIFTDVQNEYKKPYEHFRIEFEGQEIEFKFVCQDIQKWNIRKTRHSVIQKERVDEYKGFIDLQMCVFKLTWLGLYENPTDITLKLLGAKPPDNFCNFILNDLSPASTTTLSTQAESDQTSIRQSHHVRDQQLDTMISNDHINEVSLWMVRWEDVAHQLNVDRLEITEIQQTPGISAVARNHKVLQTWKSANFQSATYRKLVEALEKLREMECADKVCQLIRDIY